MATLIHDKLAFTTGAYMNDGYSIELVGQEVFIKSFSGHPNNLTDVKKIKPSQNEWEDFWGRVEALKVWKWNKKYYNPNVMDGSYWDLKLEHEGNSLESEGINSFPKFYNPFLKALAELIGGLNVT